MDRAGVLRAPDLEVGFLDDVVDVAHRGKLTAKPGFELSVVGVDFVSEPLGLVRRDGARRRRCGRGCGVGRAHGEVTGEGPAGRRGDENGARTPAKKWKENGRDPSVWVAVTRDG